MMIFFFLFKFSLHVQSIGFFRQARSQDQFFGGCRTPQNVTFWTQTVDFLNHIPLNPLTKIQFLAHFVAKSGPFGRFWGPCLAPPGYGPVFMFQILSHISKAFLCNFRLSLKAFCYTYNYGSFFFFFFCWAYWVFSASMWKTFLTSLVLCLCLKWHLMHYRIVGKKKKKKKKPCQPSNNRWLCYYSSHDM